MVLVLRSAAFDTDADTWQPLCEAGMLSVVYLDNMSEIQSRITTPEEQAAMLLMQITISPHDRSADAALVPTLATTIAQTKNTALQQQFRDLFVNLFVSKYKTLTLAEVRAMIQSTDIFDDIFESLAVQEYGEEQRTKGKLEGVPNFLDVGLTPEQIAHALDLPLSTVQEIQQQRRSQ
jgi:predicted transposase YdaD